MTRSSPAAERISAAACRRRIRLALADGRARFWLGRVPDSACRVACPAGVNVKAYLGLIAAGQFEKALRKVLARNPLPGICGRVCTHPCENECRRGELDAPVAIRRLKRFVADYALQAPAAPPDLTAPRDLRPVAVVGSGPAGLTAASDLARLGYRVTVFEALSRPGGMLRLAIPEFRLPHAVVEQEIAAVCRLGVVIETGAPVDDPARLLRQGFAAAFFAVGAQAGQPLGLEPEHELEGVVECLDFLRSVNLGRPPRLSGTVLLVGGGNSALDSARTALRLGASRVEIVYRRSRRELPADPEEVAAGLAEGIRIRFLAQPVGFVIDAGRVAGLRCVRTRLAAPDASGRRRPVPVPGTEFELKCQTVIKAVGQRPDCADLGESGAILGPAGTVRVDPETGATSIPGLFAGGDVVTGPATVIDAISAGHRAAAGIDAFLSGRRPRPHPPSRQLECVSSSPEAAPAAQPRLSHPDRVPMRSFAEVEPGLSEAAAVAEAGRCLRCGPCAECAVCRSPCSGRPAVIVFPGGDGHLLIRVPASDPAFADPTQANPVRLGTDSRVAPALLVPLVARVNPELCRGCGRCVEVCPHQAIRLEATAPESAVVDPALCRGCGICVTVCPSSAIKDPCPLEERG